MGQGHVLVSHFFWDLGTDLQKTQEGLQRSILYQILDKLPSLVKEALPEMWMEAVQLQMHTGVTDRVLALPSKAEMNHAFEVIINNTTRPKICILIDGLDEFSGVQVSPFHIGPRRFTTRLHQTDRLWAGS